jgi:sulfate adenylyltransferase
MMQEVYKNCVAEMRLPGSNLLFGIPVVMDTDSETYQPGMSVKLSYGDQVLGVLEIDSKWMPDKATEALKCYGTSSLEHPGVLMISTERGKYYIGGKVCNLAYTSLACLRPQVDN